MIKHKFSIITPSYNQAKFLPRTLTSILTQQGDFSIELLVEDGGSTDGSLEILQSFERLVGDRTLEGLASEVSFSWVSEKDRGQSHAINKGLAKASGDIMAYLNSDDMYLPGAFAAVSEHFQSRSKSLWCYGDVIIVDQDDKQSRAAISTYKSFLAKHYSRSKLLVVNYISQPATFWRQAAYLKLGGFSEMDHLVMDYDYWCRLARISPASFINQQLAAFRTHKNSKSTLDNKRMFEEGYAVACRNTENPLLRLGHRLHDQLVCLVYSKM